MDHSRWCVYSRSLTARTELELYLQRRRKSNSRLTVPTLQRNQRCRDHRRGKAVRGVADVADGVDGVGDMVEVIARKPRAGRMMHLN